MSSASANADLYLHVPRVCEYRSLPTRPTVCEYRSLPTRPTVCETDPGDPRNKNGPPADCVTQPGGVQGGEPPADSLARTERR